MTVLPVGGSAGAQFAVKATARLDFARVFSALVEVFYTDDPNLTKPTAPCDQQPCPLAGQFASPHQLG